VVGVAPGASLISVKVLNCKGDGYVSDVVAGINWVTADAQAPENAGVPAVANMSLGGGRSRSLNAAVRNSAASRVFYSLSAGNEGRNACKSSPAMTGAGKDNGIVTTAATTRRDKEPRWSNFGSCVDLWAPGTNILSTRLGGSTTTMSGTSMASPHVGGTGALYLSDYPSDSPVTVENVLKTTSELTGKKSKNGAPIRLVDAEKASPFVP
jgi:aqualysin 1